MEWRSAWCAGTVAGGLLSFQSLADFVRNSRGALRLLGGLLKGILQFPGPRKTRAFFTKYASRSVAGARGQEESRDDEASQIHPLPHPCERSRIGDEAEISTIPARMPRPRRWISPSDIATPRLETPAYNHASYGQLIQRTRFLGRFRAVATIVTAQAWGGFPTVPDAQAKARGSLARRS